MSQTQRVTPRKITIGGQITRLGAPIPTGLSPILRRFWDFARKMAKEFSKHLTTKDKEEDFLKVVRREFEKDRG